MECCLGDVSILGKYIVHKILENYKSGPDLMHLNEKNSYGKYVESLNTGDNILSFKLQKDHLYNLLSFFSCLVMEVGL